MRCPPPPSVSTLALRKPSRRSMAACGDGELFRSRDAQLYMEEGEESVLMQCGDFALVLVKNAVSHLAAVVAVVGALHWPVGRDCAVRRTGETSFSFSLPGPLCYALVLGGTSSTADVERLGKVLVEYSMCSAPQQRPAAVAAGIQDEEGSKQEEKSAVICRDESQSRKRSVDDLGPEVVGRIQKARQMSAVVKVFSRSLERGAINIIDHVQPLDLATQDSRPSPGDLALAGVDAVAKVVEAITGSRSLLESALSTAATDSLSGQVSGAGFSQRSLKGLISSDWTLNEHGLFMLHKVITASMAMQSGLSSRSGSSRSGSSSSSEIGRRLSSSSSSSSLSNKSFVASAPYTQAVADSQGNDSASMAALPLSAARAVPLTCPPPPPLFAASAPRARMFNMSSPPSGPVPPPPPPSEFSLSSSVRVCKPDPTPAMPPLAGPPLFPPRPRPRPRPPRHQPPQR